MKYATLTAFLPNLTWFPSPRGQHGSSVPEKPNEKVPGGSSPTGHLTGAASASRSGRPVQLPPPPHPPPPPHDELLPPHDELLLPHEWPPE